jgi:hypothetical protein
MSNSADVVLFLALSLAVIAVARCSFRVTSQADEPRPGGV